MANDLQNNNSQYNIPQIGFADNIFEAEQAAILSSTLEAEPVREIVDLTPRIDARQQAVEAATIEARNAAMAAYAQHEPLVQTIAQPQPIYHQQQPVVSQPYYRERPELNTAPYYAIKEVERRIDDARKAQLELDARKHIFSRTLKSFVVSPKPPLAVLKQKEAVIGGEIVSALYAQQGIQMDDRIRLIYDNHDWFLYREGNYDDAVHYEATDVEVKKSQYGHIVSLEPGEGAAFLMLAPMYEKAVIERLYPIDAIITELMAPEPAPVDYIHQRAA